MTIIEQLKALAQTEFKTLPQPYDFASLTTIEQIILLRKTLVHYMEETNTFVDLTSQAFNELAIETDCDMNKFVNHLECICHKYMDLMDEKLRRQNNQIDNLYLQFTTELLQTINTTVAELVASGEFDEEVINAINTSSQTITQLTNEFNSMKSVYTESIDEFNSLKQEVQTYSQQVSTYLGEHLKVSGTISVVDGYAIATYQLSDEWNVDNCMVLGVNISTDNQSWSPTNAFVIDGRFIECSVTFDGAQRRITIVVNDPDLLYEGNVYYRMILFKR